MQDINLLVRGQSNALLFADRGGASALERGLEQALGADVHIIAEYGTSTSTIHSATAFMDWAEDGQQRSLLRHIEGLAPEVKDNPTVTLWMHNEYDQALSFSAEDWAAAVREDAALVRGALGQEADTTPYVFEWVSYPWGRNGSAIREGMQSLIDDPAFNASMGDSTRGLAMDGDGFAGSSHMGDADVRLVGQRLAESLGTQLAPLAQGDAAPAVPVPVPATVEAPPAAPVEAVPPIIELGSGPDTLVLQVSQDSYKGDARYTVRVDGQQVGDVLTAFSAHGSGQSDTVILRGDWGPGEQLVEIDFLNDLWEGTPETDRNLYVTASEYNGIPGTALGETWWGGSFTVTDAVLA